MIKHNFSMESAVRHKKSYLPSDNKNFDSFRLIYLLCLDNLFTSNYQGSDLEVDGGRR